MKSELIAVPVFQNRISPLMDVSNRYIIYETEGGEIKQKIDISLNAEGEPQRVEKLKDIGVNTIICGAVSGYVAHIIGEKGMRLLPMIYGPIDEVIDRYLDNSLSSYCPKPEGCVHRKRKSRKGCARRAIRERNDMDGNKEQMR
jgi:predicted Fe-Mo cluster-binding NifX family protein